jgi:hypothetical protein
MFKDFEVIPVVAIESAPCSEPHKPLAIAEDGFDICLGETIVRGDVVKYQVLPGPLQHTFLFGVKAGGKKARDNKRRQEKEAAASSSIK